MASKTDSGNYTLSGSGWAINYYWRYTISTTRNSNGTVSVSLALTFGTPAGNGDTSDWVLAASVDGSSQSQTDAGPHYVTSETGYETTKYYSWTLSKNGYSGNISFAWSVGIGSYGGPGQSGISVGYDSLSYSVGYSANGGSSTPSTQTKYYGVSLTLASAISRASSTSTFSISFNGNGASNPSSLTGGKTISYTFSKWKATDGTQYSAGESYTANAATTMTAQWTSGTSYTSITLPSITRTGYEFKGWYTASSGGTRVGGAGDSVSPTSATTYYAQWTATYSKITSATNVTCGESASVTWTPNSTSFRYKLVFMVNMASVVITDYITPGTTSSYTYQCTIPLSACNLMPNGTSGTLSVILISYLDTTELGRDTVSRTVYVPSSIVPVFTIEKECTNDVLSAHLIGTAGEHDSVKYSSESTFNLNITATPQYLANAVSVSVVSSEGTFNESFSSNYASVNIGKIGDGIFTVTVTDTRGRSTVSSLTIARSDYSSDSSDANVTYSESGGEYKANYSISLEAPVIPDSLSPSDYVWNEVKLTISKKNLSTGVSSVVAEYSSISESSSTRITNGTNSISLQNQDIDAAPHEVTFTYEDSYGVISVYTITLYINGVEYSEDNYYSGMKTDGTKSSESVSSVISGHRISVTKTSGSEFAGVGLPIKVSPGQEYMFHFEKSDSVAKVYASFFTSESAPHTYMSNTEITDSGSTVTVPSNAEWMIIIFGVNGNSQSTVVFENSYIVYNYSEPNPSIEWLLETGIIGLSTPNTKYISGIQLRADYKGQFNLDIEYENYGYKNVLTKSTSTEEFRSINIPINVIRHDRFKMKLYGTGAMKLYSLGFSLEEGSELC